MKTLITAIIFLSVYISAFGQPAHIVNLDMQQSGRPFKIDSIKYGSTPSIKANLYEDLLRNVKYTNLSGYVSFFRVYTNLDSQTIWSFTNESITGNQVLYNLPAIGIEPGTYRAQFVFTNTVRDVSFGHIGRVKIQRSPGTGSDVTTNDPTKILNFDTFTESGTVGPGVTFYGSFHGDGSNLTNLPGGGGGAGTNAVTSTNTFSSADLLVKSSNTLREVTLTGISVDDSNNMLGVNDLTLTGNIVATNTKSVLIGPTAGHSGRTTHKSL